VPPPSRRHCYGEQYIPATEDQPGARCGDAAHTQSLGYTQLVGLVSCARGSRRRDRSEPRSEGTKGPTTEGEFFLQASLPNQVQGEEDSAEAAAKEVGEKAQRDAHAREEAWARRAAEEEAHRQAKIDARERRPSKGGRRPHAVKKSDEKSDDTSGPQFAFCIPSGCGSSRQAAAFLLVAIVIVAAVLIVIFVLLPLSKDTPGEETPSKDQDCCNRCRKLSEDVLLAAAPHWMLRR